MAAPAHFGDIFRAPDLVQSGCDVIVKSENKFILLMTNPAAAQGRLGNARAYPFKERERPVEGVVMTILTVRHVFYILLGFLFLI